MNKQCETPCLCDTCLKARDEELNRLREGLVGRVEELKKSVGDDPYDRTEGEDEAYNEALDEVIEHLKK